ncbi:Aste57867_7100 [Aphanomyces stellatus]|uniref:Aste57867_5685 protein n=1 Tax=Aphanomyces stellatus TaxID=120398 RepID=A0A485KFR5_9STRA|nr:hypothetical protein As57867_007077 [Aphanomyces stellatus]KAF0709977.1 hypothetical protein As57867_005672 [Aphanomyces stellatus]VFT82725.1 Aste57867_5685 [Aphanomyces stellatus]VFT84036.1 Aste57867_7100 [Aphanomyces stellatus]
MVRRTEMSAMEKEAQASDRLAKTRLYFRNFMRTYRQKEKDEVQHLRSQIYDLEAQLEKLACASSTSASKTKDGRLPWNEVATALKEDMDGAMRRNADLKKKSQKLYVVLHGLYNWVLASSQVPESPNSSIPTWRNTSLLANPTGRRCGKEWIMRQMYESADDVFRQRQYPSMDSNEQFYDLNIQFSDDSFNVVARRQVNDKREFNYFVQRYRENLFTNMLLQGFIKTSSDNVAETTESTRLHQLIAASGEFVNILTAEFWDGLDRCMFVVQNIIDDETISGPNAAPKLLRHRTMWVEMRRIADGTTKMRNLYMVSQAFTKASGFLPLDVDAVNFYCDLGGCPPEWKELMFRRRVLNIFSEANIDHVGDE